MAPPALGVRIADNPGLAFCNGARPHLAANPRLIRFTTRTTMTFAENLQQLPAINHLAALQLFNAAGELVATLENKPGKAGSLAVYAALAARHGSINLAAAQEGLVLFAEHTADARLHPGSHPNIDRLFEIIATGQALSVKPVLLA